MGSSICVSCYISRSIKEETKTQMGLFVYVSELQFGWALNPVHLAHSPATWKCHITKKIDILCTDYSLPYLEGHEDGNQSSCYIYREFPLACVRHSAETYMVFKSFDARSSPERRVFLFPVYKTTKLKELELECI